MKYYNGEDLSTLVKDGVTIVDFYADWCGPCKMLGMVLEEIQTQVNIVKVNTDTYSDLANQYKVMSIPHLVFFKDGKEITETTGFMDKSSLLEKIEEVKNM